MALLDRRRAVDLGISDLEARSAVEPRTPAVYGSFMYMEVETGPAHYIAPPPFPTGRENQNKLLCHLPGPALASACAVALYTDYYTNPPITSRFFSLHVPFVLIIQFHQNIGRNCRIPHPTQKYLPPDFVQFSNPNRLGEENKTKSSAIPLANIYLYLLYMYT